MRSLKSFAVAGAVVIGAATFAHAGDLPVPPPPPPHFDAPLRGTVSATSGFYLRGDIGVGLNKHKPKLDLRQNGAAFAVPAGSTLSFLDSSLDGSTLFGIGVGYQFNNWLRFDVTGEYRSAARFGGRDQIDTAGARPGDPAGTTAVRQINAYSGSLSTTLLMANGYVDLGSICALGCITPYVGVGIGLANHRFSTVTDISSTTPIDAAGTGLGPTNTFTDYFRSKSRTNLAWALMAGASVDVSRNVKLELGYRYLNMGYAQTGMLASNNPANTMLRAKQLDSHDFRIGMRWLLNGGDCCGTPAPVYEPAPMVRKF